MSPSPQGSTSAVDPDQLAAVVSGTRLVGALIAESLAHVRPAITMPQWRVLALASAGDCNVSAVAEDLGVHMSNASRTCDRLVTAGLVERRRAEQDRRHVLLTLTPAGRRFFEQAMEYRSRRLEKAMTLMTDDERADLARSFNRFTEAAAEVKNSRGKQG